jgi:hypothetical protein
VLNEITATLRRTAGLSVDLGTIPTNALARATISVHATDEPARAVLARTLAATGARLSWALYYGPDTPSYYVLNIHGVPHRDTAGSRPAASSKR